MAAVKLLAMILQNSRSSGVPIANPGIPAGGRSFFSVIWIYSSGTENPDIMQIFIEIAKFCPVFPKMIIFPAIAKQFL